MINTSFGLTKKFLIQVLLADRDETLEATAMYSYKESGDEVLPIINVELEVESGSHTLADEDLDIIIDEVTEIFEQRTISYDDYDDGDTILFDTILEAGEYTVTYSDLIYTANYPVKKLNAIMQKAQDAFWHAVAGEFPEITHGDFSPEDSIKFDNACKLAINHWIRGNKS